MPPLPSPGPPPSQALGFDVVELSTGFISLPLRDWTNLVEDVKDAGLQVRGGKRRCEGAASSCNAQQRPVLPVF
jgi:phosphosulfolactate synthase (CoM biosynthesis protein A)